MLIKESGSPNAVIVLVHGAFEHAGRYDWLSAQLSERGYHVVYGDLPGQGQSEGKKGVIQAFDQYIEVVSQWIDQAMMYHLPVFLIGHSMGGLTAIRLLQEKNPPIQGVILSSPALGISNRPGKPLYYLSKLLNILTPSMLLNSNIQSEMATRNKAFYTRDSSDPLYLKKVSVRWYHEFEKAISIAFNKVGQYPDIPTLILQAGEDLLVPVVNVENWFNQLKIGDQELKIWQGLYHEVFNEPERKEVLDYALAFIERRLNELK
ncbi:alpha/beta hydrolase [Alkalibacillus aidingensis]|uniref:alpha/beta hydrolase n=1 Tax=Alkalibacillus aidingensis TaxID=2747607 RepID=UPI00166154EF|nr:alpha/beta hydrolase [Alkalibacillus aidingensis]